MKSSELRGFTSVLRFTLSQTFKQKSYTITLIIMLLISILSFPIIKLVTITDDDTSKDNIDSITSAIEETTTIKKAYVVNETNIENIPFTEMYKEDENIENIEFEASSDDLDTACKKLDEAAKAGDETAKNAVIIHALLDMENGGYSFTVCYSNASAVSADDAESLSDAVCLWFSDYKNTSIGVSDETIENISAEVTTKVVDYDDFVDEKELKPITTQEYNVVYIVLMVFYIVICMTSSMVANKIVEEKANRIVEYLMTTIRPMALILGKVIAMIIAGVGEIVLIMVAGFASYKVSEQIWPSDNENITSGFISFDGIKGLSFGNIALAIFILIVGVFLYSLIAGLFGASVSKMEEIQQGLKVFTIILLVAFFAVLIAVTMMPMSGINTFVKVTMYIPITSVMILPGVILIGKAGLVEILISLAIMIVTTLLLFKFISLIYESIIVMNGNVISVKSMLQIAKNNSKSKGGAKDEE